MTILFKKLLSIISEELECSSDNQTAIYDDELRSVGFSEGDIRRGFNKLVADKLIVKKPEIKYAPNKRQSTNPMHADFSSAPNTTYSRLVYFLLVNKKKFTEISQRVFAAIYYNKNTGIGFVNDKRFKFKDDQAEFFVFPQLWKKIGKTLERERVLELSNYKQTSDEKFSVLIAKNSKRKTSFYISQTYFINELVKKIRRMTGLNTNQLANNNGNLTLSGTKLNTPPE